MLTLTETEQGLEVCLDKECREDFMEIYNSEDMDWYAKRWEVLEDYLCNGWTLVRPEDIGGLTSGENTILAPNFGYDDNGMPEYLEDTTIYYDPDYMVRDWIEELALGRSYTFAKLQ